MLRRILPLLIAVFAVGTAAAEEPATAKPADAARRSQAGRTACYRQAGRAGTPRRRQDRAPSRQAPASRHQARHRSRRPQPAAGTSPRQLLPRTTITPPEYVRRGRQLVVVEEEDPDVLFTPTGIVPYTPGLRHTAAAGLVGHCPAITAPAIPTATTATITAARNQDLLVAPALRLRRLRLLLVAKPPTTETDVAKRREKTSAPVKASVTAQRGHRRPGRRARRRDRRRAEDHDHRQAAALPSGPFELPTARCRRAARMGRGADRSSARLCRTALHIRRPGPDRRCQDAAHDLDQLSRPDPRGPGRRRFEAHWSGWYDYFPWEDHRAGLPALLAKMLAPRLRAWAKSAPSADAAARALAARRYYLRPRRPRLERGTGAAALRAAL